MVGHRQGTVCGVQGAGRPGAVRVHHFVGGVEGGARRGQQGGRLLGVVLEGGKHLRGVDARDRRQLGLRALEVGEFLREALACLADPLGQRRLFRALGREGGLDLAERVQVCAEVAHELLRELQALGRGCRVVHAHLKIEAARDGCLRIFDCAGKLVRRGQAKLGAREVQLVGRGAYLLVGCEQLAIGFLDGLLCCDRVDGHRVSRALLAAARGGGDGDAKQGQASEEKRGQNVEVRPVGRRGAPCRLGRSGRRARC